MDPIFVTPAVLIGGAVAFAIPVMLRSQPRIPHPTPDSDPNSAAPWAYRGWHRRDAPRRRVAGRVPAPFQAVAVPLPPRPAWTQPVPQDAGRVNDAITEALHLGVPAAYAVGDAVTAPDSRSWFGDATETFRRCDDATVVLPRTEVPA